MDTKKIGKLAYPSYKGRKFREDRKGRVTFYDLNWSGGTRNTYTLVRLTDGATDPGVRNLPPWANPFEGKTVEIPAGFAIVEHSFFCGKDSGLTVYYAKQEALGEANA